MGTVFIMIFVAMIIVRILVITIDVLAVFRVAVLGVRLMVIMLFMVFLTMIVMIILFAMGCRRYRFFLPMLTCMLRLRFFGVAGGCGRKTSHQNGYQCFIHVYHSCLIR